MKSSLKLTGKKLVGVLSVFLLVLVTISSHAQNGIKDAMKLIEQGDPNKAIESLNKSISEQPTALNLLYYLGYAQIKAGQVDKAMETFNSGIAKNEKEAILYAGKGHVYILKKNVAEAKVQFEKATSLSKSKNVEVFQAIGRGYLADAATLKDGIAALEKAKALKADNVETYYLLGDAYLAQKNGGSAVSNYEWAATYEPQSGKGHYKGGMVYLRTRDYKIAEESFKKAIAADPNFAPAYDELADLAYNNSQGAEALKYWQKYMQLTGNRDQDKAREAYYRLMTKDFTGANAIFDELRRKGDVSLQTLRYNAYALYEEGKFAESIAVFDQYFQKVDTANAKPADYSYRGQALIKANPADTVAVDKGIENLKLSLKKEPKQPMLVKTIGDMQYKRKKYPDAIVYYKQYMANSKGSQSNDLFSIGRAYYFNKQYLQADTAFTKLVELQPTVPQVHLWVSRTKAQLEDMNKTPGSAKPAYEKLIEVSLPTVDKNKAEVIEGYSYLVSYYGVTKDDLSTARTYVNKILALDPANKLANDFVKEMKKAEQPKK